MPPDQLLSYICGLPNYMRMCVYGLREVGVPVAHIRKENFSTKKPAAPTLPPDTEVHGVTLFYRNQSHRLRVQYPVTILKAARQAGLNLPYSCEAGRVWHTYNEVLTNKELAKGLILTCAGYPIGGDVVLSIP